MDTLYELTEAECAAVAGGSGGQIVASFNHNSGFFGAAAFHASAGPGFFLHDLGGRVVSSTVDLVQDLAPPK